MTATAVAVNGLGAGPFDALVCGAEGFEGMHSAMCTLVRSIEEDRLSGRPVVDEQRLDVAAPPDPSDPEEVVEWRGYLRCFDMLVASGVTCRPLHPDNCGADGPAQSVLTTLPPERSRVASARQRVPPGPFQSIVLRGLCDMAKDMPDWVRYWMRDLAAVPSTLLHTLRTEAVGGERLVIAEARVPVPVGDDEPARQVAPYGSTRKGAFPERFARRPVTYSVPSYLFMYAFTRGPLLSVACEMGTEMLTQMLEHSTLEATLEACMGAGGELAGSVLWEDVLGNIIKLVDRTRGQMPPTGWRLLQTLISLYRAHARGRTVLQQLDFARWLIRHGAPPPVVREAALVCYSCSAEDKRLAPRKRKGRRRRVYRVLKLGQVEVPASIPPTVQRYIAVCTGLQASKVPTTALNLRFCPPSQFFRNGTLAFGTDDSPFFGRSRIDAYVAAILAFLRHRALAAAGTPSPPSAADGMLPSGYAVGLPTELMAHIVGFLMLR